MKHPHLSSGETTSLIKWSVSLSPPKQLAILFLLCTGVRVSELTQLLMSDLTPTSANPEHIIVRDEIAKNGAGRRIPLKPIIVDLLRQRNASHNPHLQTSMRCTCSMLVHKNDERVKTRTIQHWVNEAGIHALGRPLSPHCLRHTFATHIMKTTDIRTVQYLMGHRQLHSTMLYTHIIEDRVNDAIKNLVF